MIYFPSLPPSSNNLLHHQQQQQQRVRLNLVIDMRIFEAYYRNFLMASIIRLLKKQEKEKESKKRNN